MWTVIDERSDCRLFIYIYTLTRIEVFEVELILHKIVYFGLAWAHISETVCTC